MFGCRKDGGELLYGVVPPERPDRTSPGALAMSEALRSTLYGEACSSISPAVSIFRSENWTPADRAGSVVE